MIIAEFDLSKEDYQNSAPNEIRGQFFGAFALRPLESDEEWETVYDFGYVDKKGTVIHIKAGTRTDGLSIPRFAWSLVGNPFQPRPAPAAVVHDEECRVRKYPPQEVHARFYEMLKVRKFNPFRSWLYYQAVKYFHPGW